MEKNKVEKNALAATHAEDCIRAVLREKNITHMTALLGMIQAINICLCEIGATKEKQAEFKRVISEDYPESVLYCFALFQEIHNALFLSYEKHGDYRDVKENKQD